MKANSMRGRELAAMLAFAGLWLPAGPIARLHAETTPPTTNTQPAVNINPDQIVIKPEPPGKLRPIFAKLAQEKLRFGYSTADMYRSPDEPKLPEPLPAILDASKYRFDGLKQMAQAGFSGVNLLFGGWTGGPGELTRLEPCLRLWAEGCKRHQLYMIASIQYGQFAKTYRRFYNGAGKEASTAICPRGGDYWREEMLARSSIIAKVSKEYPGVLLGENFDFEMYIPDFTQYPGACMCNVCFGDFMKEFAPGIDPKTVPATDRCCWLKVNDLTPLYYRFMEREISGIAGKIEKAMHQINPDFVLTYFPAFEWMAGLTRGFGTPEQPVVVFSEVEYTPGFSSVIAERKQRLEKEGYPALYCPGLWLVQHNPKNIPSQLYQMALASDGYWIYEVYSFSLEHADEKSFLYKGSTRQENWDAFRLANTAIQERLKKGPSYRPSFALSGPVAKEIPHVNAPYATNPPSLDGAFTDSIWAKAEALVLNNNATGEIYSPRTIARIAYDNKYLYIAVQCTEPEMGKLKAVVKTYGNFEIFNDDVVEIFLDPGHTMSACFHIGINSLGTVAEHRFHGVGQEDRSWQSGVRVSRTLQKDGWDLALAFPLEQLVADTKLDGKVWGINIARQRAISGVPEETRLAAWSPTFGLFNEPTRFGEVKFVSAEPPAK